jgi:hypothetical protein
MIVNPGDMIRVNDCIDIVYKINKQLAGSFSDVSFSGRAEYLITFSNGRRFVLNSYTLRASKKFEDGYAIEIFRKK